MNKYYPNLFSPIYIGKTRLKNRIVMSAMDTHMFAMDGTAVRSCPGRHSYCRKKSKIIQ